MADVSTDVNPDDVRGIFEGEAAPITNTALGKHIEAASNLVADVEAAAKASGTPVSDDRLADIHTYLAAHYATAQAGRKETERGESYRADWLRETSYGEIAIQLDPTDALDNSKEKSASLRTGNVRGSKRQQNRRENRRSYR
jgi:hypothetical protein